MAKDGNDKNKQTVYKARADEERDRRIAAFTLELLGDDESAAVAVSLPDSRLRLDAVHAASAARDEATTEAALLDAGLDVELARELAKQYPGARFNAPAAGLLRSFAEKAASAERVHTGHRARLRAAIENDSRLDSLSDAEVLETLLSFCIPRKDVRPIADELLSEHNGSLYDVISAPESELLKTKSMTASAAELISLLPVISSYSVGRDISIRTYADAIGFFGSLHFGDGERGTYVAYLDAEFGLIALEKQGGDRLIDVHRTVGAAIRHSASYVFVSRNEDSLMPARFNSIESVRALAEVLETVGIRLMDCMVFNSCGFYSLGPALIKNSKSAVFVFEPLTAAMSERELVEKLVQLKFADSDEQLPAKDMF